MCVIVWVRFIYLLAYIRKNARILSQLPSTQLGYNGANLIIIYFLWNARVTHNGVFVKYKFFEKLKKGMLSCIYPYISLRRKFKTRVLYKALTVQTICKMFCTLRYDYILLVWGVLRIALSYSIDINNSSNTFGNIFSLRNLYHHLNNRAARSI